MFITTYTFKRISVCNDTCEFTVDLMERDRFFTSPAKAWALAVEYASKIGPHSTQELKLVHVTEARRIKFADDQNCVIE